MSDNVEKLNFLTRHAVYNVWANPHQDDQSIQELQKITVDGGSLNILNILNLKIDLPTKGEYYHVYQLGQLNPEFLGMLEKPREWVRLDEMCKQAGMIINIYTTYGLEIPKIITYARWTSRRNLIFAIRKCDKIPYEFDSDHLYFRFYSGNYFNVTKTYADQSAIDVLGYEIHSSTQKGELLDFYNKYNTDQGGLHVWHNGILVKNITARQMEEGDIVEMLWDSTIYKIIIAKLDDLNTFTSILDNMRKYLFTYDGAINNTIDYFDDIDFYVVRHKNNNNDTTHRGVYYHRNNSNAVRQLTHRDYSLVVNYISKYISDNNQNNKYLDRKIFKDMHDVYIEAYIRRGRRDRNLVYNSSMIHELYKLPFDYRVGAILGVNSNVSVWRADQLEQSPFMNLVGSDKVIFDTDKVIEGYGYHSVSQLLGMSPVPYSQFNTSSQPYHFKLPYSLAPSMNGWEYDELGRLLGFYNNFASAEYYIRNPNTKLVECFYGNVDAEVGELYNATSYLIEPTEDYRVYICTQGQEANPDKWQDVTDNENNLFYFQNVNASDLPKGTVQLIFHDQSNNDTQYTYMVRKDNNSVADRIMKTIDNGIVDFFLTEKVLDNKNKLSKVKMMVPRGHLNVFCNGHALVQGVDYFVNFPRVIITTKEYFIKVEEGTEQEIVWHMSDFCDNQCRMLNPEETGYIQHNRLSYDKKFQCRDDQVQHYIIGGAVYDKSVLGFPEDQTENKINNRGLLEIEGKPYQIKDVIVPYSNMSDRDYYLDRDKAIKVDEEINDYMSLYFPQKHLGDPLPFNALYKLYSPFIAWITSDLRRNVFVFDKMTSKTYSDQDVSDACKPYEWLLDYDPVYQTDCIDWEYVICHPFPHDYTIDLDIYRYRLLNRINDFYMKGKVKLSHFIRIQEI